MSFKVQSRKASLIEACANTALGFVIAMITTAMTFRFLHIQASATQQLSSVSIFTVISVIRSYFIRRMWNAEWWKRFKRNHVVS